MSQHSSISSSDYHSNAGSGILVRLIYNSLDAATGVVVGHTPYAARRVAGIAGSECGRVDLWSSRRRATMYRSRLVSLQMARAPAIANNASLLRFSTSGDVWSPEI